MKKLILILPLLFLIACEGEEQQLANTDKESVTPPPQYIQPEGSLGILDIQIPTDPACNQEGYDLEILENAQYLQDKLRVDFFVMGENNNQMTETLEINISGDTVEFVHEFEHVDGYMTSMSIYGIMNEAQTSISVDLGCSSPLNILLDNSNGL